jgi:hypothetical protein
MRVLLDECLPRRLRSHFPGHDVHTVPEMGWAGKKDAELLSLMQGDGFEVLVTADRGIRHQQNLPSAGVAVIVLVAATNRLTDLIPRVAGALAALATIQPGDVVEITT